MKHFDHEHSNAFELLTCKSAPADHRVVAPAEPMPKVRADYRTVREIEKYGRI